jgi:hypothetical protein
MRPRPRNGASLSPVYARDADIVAALHIKIREENIQSEQLL